ncbi:hypothetical protein CUC15_03845 [Oceanobacillus zhaokaii]|uniref:Uncharacterized protein n=1 Tax=Oceanobacillus zhaokaii TaxID=2052660 RepID=A0A345PDS0_9BACI|nr:hypothetical protein [Oceanobacillus zhaokaii]AXI08150.1 hypothetical protein CUC15_03845 [Oceanobacillus zhaokaii]
MKINKEEQETVQTYEVVTGKWNIFTSVPSHIRYYMKNPLLNKENIEVLTEHEGKPTSIRFTVEDSIVTKSFLRKRRTISEEHKQALHAGKHKWVLQNK